MCVGDKGEEGPGVRVSRFLVFLFIKLCSVRRHDDGNGPKSRV